MAPQHDGEEHIKINIPDGNILQRQNNSLRFITCAIIMSAALIGMFTFCLVFHQLVKDPCYAHASFNNITGWNWHSEEIVKRMDNSTVKIKSAGVYLINIQVFSTKNNGIADLVLFSNENTSVGGSFESPTGAYATLSQILQLKAGDVMTLRVNGNIGTISNETGITYWKILKVSRI